MATNSDIVLAKGSYSVTLPTKEVTESVKNTLKIVAGKGGQSEDNQSKGPKNTIIVDLLRITEAYHIETYIIATATYTAKQIKDQLREIVKGGGINGGEISFTYEDEVLKGYIEDMVIKKSGNDDVVGNSYTGNDSAEYHVTIDFTAGEKV